MKIFRPFVITLPLILVAGMKLFGQISYIYPGSQLNTITTAVPFLIIAPDARSGSLGEAGTSTSPDINSQFWNPAKYPFIKKKTGASLSYSPWLRSIKSDINLGYFSAYFKPDSNQCIAASFKAISLGKIYISNIAGNVSGVIKPFEFAGDVSYSRKLSDVFSMGLSLRYIYSDLGNNALVQTYKPGTSFAGDISLFYSRPVMMNGDDGQFNFGLNISNVGNKISYSKTSTARDFIPTRIMLGPSFTLPLSHRTSLSFIVELSKLLVPTPPIYATDSTGTHIIAGKDPNVSVFQGMVQSFSDAPGGFREEMREIDVASGIEFTYKDMFAIRTGFFYEDSTKGNRKFFTFGIGFKYNVFAFDVSYLITLDQLKPHKPDAVFPLANTVRFTLSADIDSFRRKRIVCPGMSGK